MLRSFTLQSHEIEQHRALEEEKQALYARFGALTLNLEAVRAKLASHETRSQDHLKFLAASHQISEYRWLQVERDQLVGDVVDAPEVPHVPGEKLPMTLSGTSAEQTVNGKGD